MGSDNFPSMVKLLEVDRRIAHNLRPGGNAKPTEISYFTGLNGATAARIKMLSVGE
jgi:hypothetical protein